MKYMDYSVYSPDHGEMRYHKDCNFIQRIWSLTSPEAPSVVASSQFCWRPAGRHGCKFIILVVKVTNSSWSHPPMDTFPAKPSPCSTATSRTASPNYALIFILQDAMTSMIVTVAYFSAASQPRNAVPTSDAARGAISSRWGSPRGLDDQPWPAAGASRSTRGRHTKKGGEEEGDDTNLWLLVVLKDVDHPAGHPTSGDGATRRRRRRRFQGKASGLGKPNCPLPFIRKPLARYASRKPGYSRPTCRSQPVGLPACLGCQQAGPTEPLQ
jgi:hypothetical protein